MRSAIIDMTFSVGKVYGSESEYPGSLCGLCGKGLKVPLGKGEEVDRAFLYELC